MRRDNVSVAELALMEKFDLQFAGIVFFLLFRWETRRAEQEAGDDVDLIL